MSTDDAKGHPWPCPQFYVGEDRKVCTCRPLPAKPAHTPVRSIRVAQPVWNAAKAEAERRGETVTDAVVRFLTRYGKASS